MARVYLFDELGGLEKLYLKDVEPKDPGPGEVRYRVLSFAPNRADLYWLADTYYSSPTFPARLGLEANGVVDAVGPGVTEFKVGQRVSSMAHGDMRYCVFGEYAISPERYLIHCNEGLSAEGGSAIVGQIQTGYYALVEIANVQPRQTVMVTGGSGSSGTGAIQVAKSLGARVIATSRHHDKTDFLLGIGADAVIATEEEDVVRRIHEETDGKGVDVVFDNVTGSLMKRYMEGGLAFNARIFIVGILENNFDLVGGSLLYMFRTQATIHGYSIFNNNLIDEQLSRCKAFISKGIADGKFKPIIDSVFPFEQLLPAYDRLMSGKAIGKVIVTVP